MNCNVAQKLIQLYLDNELEETEARAVEHHVAQCRECRAQFLDLERLILAVESLPRVAAPPGLFQRTHARIAEYQQRQATSWQRRTVLGVDILMAVIGLGFALEAGDRFLRSLPDLGLDTPFDLFNSLVVVAVSVDLSLVVGIGLLVVAGSLAILQLIPQDHATSHA